MKSGKGKKYGQMSKGKGTAPKGGKWGHPTPLTHPINIPNPLVKGGGWVHPIQDPLHPVRQGRGVIQPPGYRQQMMRQQMICQSGGWFPPPFPPALRPPQWGIGYQMMTANQGLGYATPMWTGGKLLQPSGNNGPKAREVVMDQGYEASEDSETDTPRPTKKGRVRKPRKCKIWVNIHGRQQEAYYWKA